MANAVPQVVLGVAAHPDDMDFSSAGTVAAWAAAGAKVYYLILTNGNKGSADPTADPAALTALRRQEQRDAAKILGVQDVFFCDYEDGALEVTMDVKRDIVRVIRQIRPEIVITFDPSMLYNADMGFINHPDHRAAGQAALDAVYPLARDHLSFPELYRDEGLEPHNVEAVLLANFANQNYYVNITESFDTKIAAILAHGSQVPDVDAMTERMRTVANRIGASAGVSLAEGFMRINIS